MARARSVRPSVLHVGARHDGTTVGMRFERLDGALHIQAARANGPQNKPTRVNTVAITLGRRDVARLHALTAPEGRS